jgi:hypothetical protein
VWAIADEDLDRETAQKTSSVHFLRFELPESSAQSMKQGAEVKMGVDHPRYQAELVVPAAIRDALAHDLA